MYLIICCSNFIYSPEMYLLQLTEVLEFSEWKKGEQIVHSSLYCQEERYRAGVQINVCRMNNNRNCTFDFVLIEESQR